MKLRCWEGCIALIIRGKNSGRWVEVLKGAGVHKNGDLAQVVHNGEKYQTYVDRLDGYLWLCKAQAPLITNGESNTMAFIPDHWLMPLKPRGPDLTEQEIIKLEKKDAAPA